MPMSAMPEHLNSREEIDAAFPDDEQFGNTTWYGRLYRWYNKATKTMFAFSYRCHEWWAKTRKYPQVLFAIRGTGDWRFETELGDAVGGYRAIALWKASNGYLSRIQYYTRWHIAIQLAVWDKIPFAFPSLTFHWYKKAGDVPQYVPGTKPDSKTLRGKLWFGYWNHFDGDFIHWLITSAFLGDRWK